MLGLSIFAGLVDAPMSSQGTEFSPGLSNNPWGTASSAAASHEWFIHSRAEYLLCKGTVQQQLTGLGHVI